MRDYIAHKTEGDLGLELEVESAAPIPPVDRGDWLSKGEPSLRNHGIEFVSRKPFSYDGNFPQKIFRLTEMVNTPKYGAIKNSPRTSLHVHSNILDDTPAQVWCRIIAYWLVENLMTKYCGEEQREGNLFCLRLKDAEGLLDYCYEELGAQHRKSAAPFFVFTDNHRYSGQNLAAIRKFGSIEYRSMRGTTDPEVIITWCGALYRMGQNAKAYDLPSALLDAYFNLGPKGILGNLFAPGFVQELIKIKGWDELIEENALLLCQLAYFHDWKAWQEKLEALGVYKSDLYYDVPAAAPQPRVFRAPRPRAVDQQPVDAAAVLDAINWFGGR